MNAPLTRREFLLLGATLGAPLAPWRDWFGTGCDPAAWRPAAARRMAGVLGSRASARVIGTAYLEATPSDARLEPLVDQIVAGLDGGTGALRSSQAELRRRLGRRMRRDFEEDATVCLKGWIVSRTEARLCALTVLA